MGDLTSTMDVAGGCWEKNSPVRAPVFLPSAYIGDEHPGSYHRFAPTSELLERPLHDLQAAPRLQVGVAGSEHLTLFVDGCGARDVDMFASLHGPAIPDLRLLGGS